MEYYWDTLTAGKKWLWILLIIFTFPIGLIVYFLVADNGAEIIENEINAGSPHLPIQPQFSFNIPTAGIYHNQEVCFCPNCGAKAGDENPAWYGVGGLICGKCVD